jgi:hypothetical protein
VQLLPDPPTNAGAIVQLGERLLCKQEVAGSIPAGSTSIEIRPPPLKETARGCDVEIVFNGRKASREQSFDRTVSMRRVAL